MDIYTNARAVLDMDCSRMIGTMGVLRIIHVDDKYLGLRQLVQYRKSGAFATDNKTKAVTFVSTGKTAGITDV